MVISILTIEQPGESAPSARSAANSKALLQDFPNPSDVESETESGRVAVSLMHYCRCIHSDLYGGLFTNSLDSGRMTVQPSVTPQYTIAWRVAQ